MITQKIRLLLISLILLFSFNAYGVQKYYDDTPPRQSEILKGYSEDRVKAFLDSIDLDYLEGIWHFPEDMVTLSIERFSSHEFSERYKYRMVLLNAEDKSLIPGTIMGYILDSAQNDNFYIWIYSQQQGNKLVMPQKCIASLSKDNNSIIFQKPALKFKLRINFARFMPSLFKGLGISAEIENKKLPLGFRRVYPSYDENGSDISKIRYL